MWQKRAALAHH